MVLEKNQNGFDKSTKGNKLRRFKELVAIFPPKIAFREYQKVKSTVHCKDTMTPKKVNNFLSMCFCAIRYVDTKASKMPSSKAPKLHAYYFYLLDCSDFCKKITFSA